MNQLNDLLHQADAIIEKAKGDFTQFLACGGILKEIFDNSLHMAALNNILIGDLNGQPTPFELSSGQFIMIAETKFFFLSILRHGPSTNQIYFVPNHAVSVLLPGSAVNVARYRSSVRIDTDIFNSAIKIDGPSSALPVVGEVFSKDGCYEALDVTSATETPSLTLRINTAPFGNFELEMAKTADRKLSWYSLRPKEDNMLLAFDLLADLKLRRSIEYLTPFTKHPLHYVRWKAIQSLAKIDQSVGLEHICVATSDDSPDVRAAARATLARL